jgi:hypothetical protein
MKKLLSSNLEYLQNSFVSIVVLFRIFPLFTVTTQNTPTVSADPIIYSGLLTSTTLLLDLILVACAVLALLLYFWKLCCKSRIKRYRQTAFKLTLFAGEDEISFDLGTSALS